MTAAHTFVQSDRLPFVIRPAPRREPPFDDELPARHLVAVGPLDLRLPFDTLAVQPDRLELPAPHRLLDRGDQFGVQTTSRALLPELAPFARRLVIGIIETAVGRRSASQLRWHTSAGVQAGLARDAGRMTRLGTAQRPARLHSVHITEPADGVAEVAAVLQIGDRFRALALRLEGLDGRWRCVRLQVG